MVFVEFYTIFFHFSLELYLYTHIHICVKVERFDLMIDEKLAMRFRKKANELGNYKKGSLSDAFAAAVSSWLKNPSLNELTKNNKTNQAGVKYL